jgi:adenylylsulfate kinase
VGCFRHTNSLFDLTLPTPTSKIAMHRSNHKILIMGLPGAGKTTLARTLAPQLRAVVFNADGVRAHINRDLGFSHADRIEHARRMGWLCDQVVDGGHMAIADFVCPTPQTRQAFGPAYIVWVDRIGESRFEDTNQMFVPPTSWDVRVTVEGTPLSWAKLVVRALSKL